MFYPRRDMIVIGMIGILMTRMVDLRYPVFQDRTKKGFSNVLDLWGGNDYSKECLLGFFLSSVDGATNLLKWRKLRGK